MNLGFRPPFGSCHLDVIIRLERGSEERWGGHWSSLAIFAKKTANKSFAVFFRDLKKERQLTVLPMGKKRLKTTNGWGDW